MRKIRGGSLATAGQGVSLFRCSHDWPRPLPAGWAEPSKATLRDIAILTDGHVITEEEGRRLDSVTIEYRCRADKVIATEDDTTIVGGHGDDEQIQPPGAPYRSG